MTRTKITFPDLSHIIHTIFCLVIARQLLYNNKVYYIRLD